MEERRHGAGPLLVIVILVSSILSPVVVKGWRESRRSANEREASAWLKTLATAEADFRANDRDGNRVQDFWVADVAELYRHGKLIDLSLAEADARPVTPFVPSPIPKSGYFFVAMEFQEGAPGTMVPYGMDTDGSGRKVHNPSSFAFCAYPAEYGVTGRNTFVVNENNTIFKFDSGGMPMIRWPYDGDLKMDYEKID
jgi:type II secretory pathway pseudopilin PulG